MFTEAGLCAFLEELSTEKGWIELKEVARRMGVKTSTVLRWVNAGLLSPVIVCGKRPYFDGRAVEAFISEHVFSQEAAEILGVGANVVRKWTGEGHLKPVSGPAVDMYYHNLYRREDVERLRLENQTRCSTADRVMPGD